MVGTRLFQTTAAALAAKAVARLQSSNRGQTESATQRPKDPPEALIKITRRRVTAAWQPKTATPSHGMAASDAAQMLGPGDFAASAASAAASHPRSATEAISYPVFENNFFNHRVRESSGSCSVCGLVLAWPRAVGVVFADHTAQCFDCYEAEGRALRRTTATGPTP